MEIIVNNWKIGSCTILLCVTVNQEDIEEDELTKQHRVKFIWLWMRWKDKKWQYINNLANCMTKGNHEIYLHLLYRTKTYHATWKLMCQVSTFKWNIWNNAMTMKKKWTRWVVANRFYFSLSLSLSSYVWIA